MRLIILVGAMEIANYTFAGDDGEIQVHLLPRWLAWMPGLGVRVSGQIGSSKIAIHIQT